MVSIIIPVYNVEQYLRECLDSVINQTYKEIQVILVDDGSTDNSGKICDDYAYRDERVSVIHKENGGLGDARNVGLENAYGEYIYFLDSDDYIKADAIEKMLSCCIDEGAEIVCFDAETFYEDYEDDYREEFIRTRKYDSDKGAIVLELMLEHGDYYPCVPLLFFRRLLFADQPLWFGVDMMHEDELFTSVAFVRATKVAQLREKLYVRRLHAGSIMSARNTLKSITGVERCIIGMIEEREYQKDVKAKEVMSLCVQRMMDCLVCKYLTLDKSEKKEARRKVWNIKQVLKKVDYCGNKKLEAETRFFRLYVFYVRTKK